MSSAPLPFSHKKMSAADIIPGGRPARLTDERPALKAETEGKYTSGWWIRIQLRSTLGNTLHDGYGTTAYCKCMRADLNMGLFFLNAKKVQKDAKKEVQHADTLRHDKTFDPEEKKNKPVMTKTVRALWCHNKPLINQRRRETPLITHDKQPRTMAPAQWRCYCLTSHISKVTWDECGHCLATCQLHTCSTQMPYRQRVSLAR